MIAALDIRHVSRPTMGAGSAWSQGGLVHVHRRLSARKEASPSDENPFTHAHGKLTQLCRHSLWNFHFNPVSILELIGITEPDVGRDLDNIPRVMSDTLFILIRA